MCSQKIRFPIQKGSGLIFVEVAIVNASIPMLLGNNIMKPLGADIKLFSSGGGILRLGNVDICLVETGGGHYKSRTLED